jgi:uncharacterized protein YqjF (DUF2071 family)
MAQTWRDLLFAHWPVEEGELRRVVHPRLPIDTFEGCAWVGVTPFRVTGLRLRGTPPLPGASRFPEINVRTYVTVDGRAGIYFLSLDAASRPAVEAARRLYRLPYFHAQMHAGPSGGGVRYMSTRTQRDGPAAGFEGDYAPSSPPYRAEPGSFDHWAIERYCLYTADEQRRILRADIHHPPWPLQRAQATLRHNSMAAPYGLDLVGDPVLHFAARQDVVFWPLGRA